MGKKIVESEFVTYNGKTFFVFSLLSGDSYTYEIITLTEQEWEKYWEKVPKIGSFLWFITTFFNRGRYPRWFLKKFVRGFTVNGKIVIREKIKIGLHRLVLHEVGHIIGYKHTIIPKIMFPSWIGRWFKRF